jgi:hypothetical protein
VNKRCNIVRSTFSFDKGYGYPDSVRILSSKSISITCGKSPGRRRGISKSTKMKRMYLVWQKARESWQPGIAWISIGGYSLQWYGCGNTGALVDARHVADQLRVL